MPSKGQRLLTDAAALGCNVGSSVLLIYSNKYLMSPSAGFGFTFATTLCGMHYLTCALATLLLRSAGIIKKTAMSTKDLAIFTAAANVSIVTLNLSLMLNPVGYYQIAKLCIIPCTCFVEAFWLRRRFTKGVILSVILVLAGVAIVTITDLGATSNILGFVVALLSIVSSTLQQVLCRTLQQRANLGFLEFLSHTSASQGLSLIAAGPFVDYLISSNWVLDFRWRGPSLLAMLVSCSVAVGVNVSQYACLGRFQAATFQVLGHIKTVLVLLGGWLLFSDRLTLLQGCGILTAITGMVSYGHFTVKATAQPAKRDASISKLASQRSGDFQEQRGTPKASQRRAGPKLANNV